MEAIAKTRHLKGSPRKARLVIDLIRGRNVSQALNILKFTDKRAADPIAKTLRSAIANATYLAEQQNIAIDPDDLCVKTCFVDMGAHKNRRRMRPAPQGRAYREQRHYCHITILVSSDEIRKRKILQNAKKGKKATNRRREKPSERTKTAENDTEEERSDASETKEAKKLKLRRSRREETPTTETVEARKILHRKQAGRAETPRTKRKSRMSKRRNYAELRLKERNQARDEAQQDKNEELERQ